MIHLNKQHLIATILLCLGYATSSLFAGGGDAFAGSLGGSLMGSVIGSSIANSGNRSGGGDGGSGRSVDRLADRVDDMRDQISEIKRAFANDLRALRDKLNGQEEQISSLKNRLEKSENNVTQLKKQVEKLASKRDDKQDKKRPTASIDEEMLRQKVQEDDNGMNEDIGGLA